MNKPRITLSTAKRIRRLIHNVYNHHSSVGCCLHITLDDGNIDDSHIRFCFGVAVRENHNVCKELAKLLSKISRYDRAWILKMYWCPKCNDYSLYEYCGMDGCNAKTIRVKYNKNELLPLILKPEEPRDRKSVV